MKIFAATVLLSSPLGILAQSAWVEKDFSCGGFVPTPDGGIGPFLSTNKGHSVVTPSGNTKLICNFNIPDSLQPAKATHAEGFLCGTFMGDTSDSTMVATPGGKAVLTFEVKHA
jgi:hypothetical protein